MNIGKHEFTLLANRGARKFQIAALIVVSSTLCAWQRVLESSDYKAIMIGVMGLYGAANWLVHRDKNNEGISNTDTSGSA
jgi:hypothetical protein